MRLSATVFFVCGILVAAVFSVLSIIETLFLPLMQFLPDKLFAGTILFQYGALVYWLAGFLFFIVALPVVGSRTASYIAEDRFRFFCRANTWLFYVISIGFLVTAAAAVFSMYYKLPAALPVAMFFYCFGLAIAYRKAFALYHRIGIFKLFNAEGEVELSYIGNRIYSMLLEKCGNKGSVILVNNFDDKSFFVKEFSGKVDKNEHANETILEKINSLPLNLYPDYIICGSYNRTENKKGFRFEILLFAGSGDLYDKHEFEIATTDLLESVYCDIADYVTAFLSKLPVK